MKNRELIFPISCVIFAIVLYQFDLRPEGNIFVLIGSIKMIYLIFKMVYNGRN